jgi:hypothetical protein
MNPGKNIVLAALLLGLTGIRPPARATAPEPGAGLWQKAIEVYRRNQDWYPERVVILSEMLNRRGEPYSVTEIFFSLRLDAKGKIQTELQRSLKNGEDTTEKMKSKVTIRSPEEGMAPADENTISVSISDSPFDPERQDAVTVDSGGESQVLFGCRCRRFHFSYRTSIVHKGKRRELIWRGMAWLKEDSGVPLKLEFTLDPLPSLVRSLWTIYLYDSARPDRWVVKKISISGQGGFLFIKKRFRTTTTFSNHRLPPPADPAG